LTFSTGTNQPASSHAFTTDKYTKQVNINTIAKIHTTQHAQPVNLFGSWCLGGNAIALEGCCVVVVVVVVARSADASHV
jgi:hypothetical protein